MLIFVLVHLHVNKTVISFVIVLTLANHQSSPCRVVGKASSNKYSISAEAECVWHVKQHRASFGLGEQTATHPRKSPLSQHGEAVRF